MSDLSGMKAWFRDDIARVLMGVNMASHATRHTTAEGDAYREGFVAALVSTALVFGIQPDRFLFPDELPTARSRPAQAPMLR